MVEFDRVRRPEYRVGRFLLEPFVADAVGGRGDADGGGTAVVGVGDRRGDTAEAVDPFLAVDRVAPLAGLVEFGEERLAVGDGVFGRRRRPPFVEDDLHLLAREEREDGLPNAVQWR